MQTINKVLANVAQGLSSQEQAQARANIGAGEAYTAGNNITINNGVISATNTTYSAGEGLSLAGTQFSVTTPVPEPSVATNDYVLTVTGNDGNYGWKIRSNALAVDSTGNMSITLTADDIANGYADFELEKAVTTSNWVLFCSLSQIRAKGGTSALADVQKVEFGFRNNGGSFYELVTFDNAAITQSNARPKDWAVDNIAPWTYLVCRWTFTGSAFTAGDTLSTHFRCIALNAVPII